MKKPFIAPEILRLPPKPTMTTGVSQPIVSLNGKWGDITVPSYMSADRKTMQGKPTKYTCKREVTMLDEWADKNLYLRFETVNGFCEIFIDGVSVGTHKNSFLAFGFDITPYVKGKDKFEIAVEIQEHMDKLLSFSLGGILRGVALYILPDVHYTSLRTVTIFDHQFRHAELKVTYALNTIAPDVETVAVLYDPFGMYVTEKILNCPNAESLYGEDILPVANPIPWDAEHPFLYTLHLQIKRSGHILEETQLRIGIRQVDRKGNRLYVNGQEVKLRGVCRHEISPLDGRCLTPEMILADVKLYKEANCNYIRTSHYPPSEYFLDLCDEYGIYVEDELPFAFVARTLDYTQRDPVHSARYIDVFNEIYERDTNHPSVIMWSLCNESFGGYNFDLMNRHAQKIDPTRPTKFSYPMTMAEEHAPVDIWSIHYSNLEGDIAAKKDNVSVAGAPGKDMPVIHDEYAHVPCYNRTEIRRDPHVRTFWGVGLKKFWDKIWNTDGALGGAIWGGIDDTDVYRGGSSRLEWGIIDIWRRKKPEHYMTRKAYSPIRLEKININGRECLTVMNWFCHTNLNEVTLLWQFSGETHQMRGPDVEPGGTVTIEFPIAPHNGIEIKLEFIDAAGNIVDEFVFPSSLDVNISATASSPLVLKEDEDSIAVQGESFFIKFSKKTCQIETGEVKGQPVLTGGPILHMPYYRLGSWQPKSISASHKDNIVRVDIKGAYENTAEASFILWIKPDGTIHVEYIIEKLMRQLPHREKLRVGVDCGGLDELGVVFISAPEMDQFHWHRNGCYPWYPDDHISRNTGIAPRFSKGSRFAKEPSIPWSLEMKNFITNGKYDVDYKGTNDFRSLKENIYSASLYRDASSLSAVSDGKHSVRLEVDEPEALLIHASDMRITYTGTWAAVEDFRGSRAGIEMYSNTPGSAAEIEFDGTGIVWYGSVDVINGIARVYLDGKLMDDNISQRVAGVDFPGSAAGYDKKYDFPLYSVDGLPEGRHKLKIEVTGEKAPDASGSYVVVDHFRIIRKRGEEPVRFAVLNDFNYPHIAWGNYTKPPIIVHDGYKNHVTIRLEERA